MRFAYNGPRVGDERRGAIDAFPRRVVSVHVKKKTGLSVFLKSAPVTSAFHREDASRRFVPGGRRK